MAEKIYERVSEKVHERITQDSKDAFAPVIEKIVRDMGDRGFRKEDVTPAITDGFYKVIDKIK